MWNAHEILWRVSWYPKAAKKNIVSVVCTFQCDLLFMQKSVFLTCEFCVESFYE
jgi:hypothetical protein